MTDSTIEISAFDELIATHATTLWTVCSGLVAPTETTRAWTNTVSAAHRIYGTETHRSFPDDLAWLLNIARLECAAVRRETQSRKLRPGLDWALNHLDEPHREAIVFQDLVELTPTQVARVLGLSEREAVALHHLATQHLTQILTQAA